MNLRPRVFCSRHVLPSIGLVLLGGCFSDAGDPAYGMDDGSTAADTEGGAPGTDGADPDGDGSTPGSDGADDSTDPTAGPDPDNDAGSGDGDGSTGGGDPTTGGDTGQPAEPVCGDAVVDAGEACDDGTNAGTAAGECIPGCSGVVAQKTIRLSQDTIDPSMGGPANPVAIADSACPAGYKAMFADGTNRVASLAPYLGNGQVDWVVAPWTEYVNQDGLLVFKTGDVDLLGVDDDHTWIGFDNPIVPSVDFGITGLDFDYTTSELDCNDWTSGGNMAISQAHRTDELAIGPTRGASGAFCIDHQVICVEQ